MADFLTSLAARALSPVIEVQPLVPPLLGPARAGTVVPQPELEVEGEASPRDFERPADATRRRSRREAPSAVTRAMPIEVVVRDIGGLDVREPEEPAAQAPPRQDSLPAVAIDANNDDSSPPPPPEASARPMAVQLDVAEPGAQRTFALRHEGVRRAPDVVAATTTKGRSHRSRVLTRRPAPRPASPGLERPATAHPTGLPGPADTASAARSADAPASHLLVNLPPRSQRLLSPHGGHVPPPPASAPEAPAPERAHTVHVTIGRLEVRAVTAPSRPAARTRGPAMSLDEYQRSRAGGATR